MAGTEPTAACIGGKPHEWRKGRCVRCGVNQPRHDEPVRSDPRRMDYAYIPTFYDGAPRGS